MTAFPQRVLAGGGWAEGFGVPEGTTVPVIDGRGDSLRWPDMVDVGGAMQGPPGD
jgi:hypothetical protein